MNAQLTIGTLAAQAGVGVETVRYYQKRGLLAIPIRHKGAFRRYRDSDLQRLLFIRRAQRLGFTLDEIAELLALDDKNDQQQARALAIGKIADIDRRLGELTEMKAALKQLVHQCEQNLPIASCPILDAFTSNAFAASGCDDIP